MASISWRTDRTLKECVDNYAQHFGFYQLVKLLLIEKGEHDHREDECDRIDRAFTMESDVRYDFPPSYISYLRRAQNEDRPPNLGTAEFGLMALNGPLPQPYIEWVTDDLADSNATIRDFLDIFNHRLLALRYLARDKNSMSLTTVTPNKSKMAGKVDSIAGFNNKELFERIALSRRVIQTYAGLINNPRKSTSYIINLVISLFNVRVDIKQMIGQWHRFDKEDCLRLGDASAHRSLGDNTIIGRRYWDQQSLINMEMGPMDFATLNKLLPGGDYYAQLVSVIHFASNQQWDCLVSLLINKDEIPRSRLEHDSEYGFRLGQNSWLKARDGADGCSEYVIRI